MAIFTGTTGADKFLGTSQDDTYEVDSTGDLVIEAPGGGADTVHSTVNHYLRTNVEDLVLLGTATKGIGNALANHIIGNDAANILDGRGGLDTAEGGGGNDIYFVDETGDLVIEAAGGGYDRVQSRVNYTLSANIEKLILIGATALEGTGNAGANLIIGNAFDNVLDGGAGADVLRGGAGNDTYVVESKGDKIAELAARGTDTVRASITWQLGSNLENLVLTGAEALRGYGNALDNHLTGNAGANQLDGKAGADTMAGGLGDDVYLLDNAGDTVIEAAGAGFDTVRTALGYQLTDNVEALVITGRSSVDGMGNALANRLTGNTGDNRLDGLAGSDTMIGGKGDDTYVVDNAGDVVIERKGGGYDIIESAISLTLPDEVEELVLAGAALTATGNAFSNVLRGNDLANVLDGGGARSLSRYIYPVDQLFGGKGDDTYLVGNGNWEVIEYAGQGKDTIRSTSGFSLPDNVEDGVMLGSGNDTGVGNDLDNVITGNSGNNTFVSSPGKDRLIGGAGNDTYLLFTGFLAGTKLVEAADGGTDTVLISGDYSGDFVLPGNIENMSADFYANSVVLRGNALNNVLTGNYQADTLDGGVGADVMRGGEGNDTYFVDNAGDVIEERTNLYATNSVIASVSYVLPQGTQNLTLTGSARDGTGNESSNVITGNALNNVIDGKGGLDTMIGGAGNDTYVVDDALDATTEQAGAGRDTVIGDAAMTDSYMLGDNVEAMQLAEGCRAPTITGNALDNVMTGNALANRIDGAAGADLMTGGAGDDTYVVDNAGDRIVELTGGGNDTVQTYASTTLTGEIENLILGTVAAINGTGSDVGNTITGNDAVNVLDGRGGDDVLNGGGGNDQLIGGNGNDRLDGGADDDTLSGDAGNDTLDGGTGSDTLAGGTGDDRYIVNVAGAVLTEKAGEGRDTVVASLDWTLAANLEDLTLIDGAVQGTGNTGDNKITGNEVANVLAGGGGGKDVLIGGLGDDTYIVDGANVSVVETADGGGDRIIFTVNGTMGANVEVGVAGGAGAVAIIGNAGDEILGGNATGNVIDGGGGDDVIVGQAGADTLRGGDGNDVLFGEADADTLTGGTGTDEFIIGAYSELGVDRITDFVTGSDTLLVINPYASGYLLADALVLGTQANDANDFLIYDQAGGNLWIDYDANGPEAKILLATFTPGTSVAGTDIGLITEGDFEAQFKDLAAVLVI